MELDARANPRGDRGLAARRRRELPAQHRARRLFRERLRALEHFRVRDGAVVRDDELEQHGGIAVPSAG